jgi:RNA polymerase sigma factor (sigma-70 family)
LCRSEAVPANPNRTIEPELSLKPSVGGISAVMMSVMTNEPEAVYRRHAEELLRYATILVGRDAAADVMTDAFLGATGARGWSAVSEPRAYLYRAVLNQARMHHRSLSRSQARDYRTARSADAVMVEDQRDLDVSRALRSLSPQQRAAIYLTYWQDLGVAEVAGLLGVGEGTVQQHLSRGRKHLRRSLNG